MIVLCWQLRVFDTISATWSPVEREEAHPGVNKPFSRLNAAAVVFRGDVLIYGGWAGDPCGAFHCL